MIQLGLGLIGGALTVGGVCALAGVQLQTQDAPGVAIAMMVVGLATLNVASFFALPSF